MKKNDLAIAVVRCGRFRIRAIAQAFEISRSNLIRRLQMNHPSRAKKYQKAEDEGLLALVKDIIPERPTYGYRRVTALLNAKLRRQRRSIVNHKRVYRPMKQNGLLLQKRPYCPKRAHTGKVEVMSSNIRWCSDSFSIPCLNGEQVHVAFSIDAFDREVMRYIASTKGIDGQAIRDLMLETLEHRFGGQELAYSIQWLSDNGSCYTAKETVAFGYRLGLDIRTTPVYSPESNGLAEAFVKTFKRDYAWFGDLKDAKTVMSQLPHWFEDYNEKAPHKAINMLSPREFLKEQKLAS